MAGPEGRATYLDADECGGRDAKGDGCYEHETHPVKLDARTPAHHPSEKFGTSARGEQTRQSLARLTARSVRSKNDEAALPVHRSPAGLRAV